jgi:hypothetical protein
MSASSQDHPIEAHAARIVQLVTAFMDLLRSMNELSPPTQSSSGRSREEEQADLRTIQLYTRLVREGYLARVTEACRDVNAVANEELWTEMDLKGDGTGQNKDPDERVRLIYDIILPLLRALGTCYAILDRLPNPTVPQPPQSSSGQRTNAPPPPPMGMLSIQNYTDVACLLELLACTSILPLLDANILTSVEERVGFFLPKAMKGRIPRKSLLWGIAQPRSSDPSSRYCELGDTLAVAGNLMLLDRFRMLLPRHLTDLYASIFQMEQLKEKSMASRSPENSSFQTFCSRTLPGYRHGGKSDGAVVVESLLQARAYQTLLSRGMKAPVWLRQRVSKLLADLACNDLEAIVQVFVNPALVEDRSSATLRLVQALVAGKRTDQYYKSICKQLVQLLDTVLHNRGSQPRQARSGDSTSIFMVWAMLDRLPDGVIYGCFLNHFLGKEMVSTKAEESFSIHRCVRRIGILLPSEPNPFSLAKLCRIILSPLTIPCLDKEGLKPTLLGMILRIASIPSVLKSTIKEDALWVLQKFVAAMIMSTFKSKDGSTVAGVDVLSMLLVHALAPNQWDLAGYRFSAVSPEPDNMYGYDRVRLEKVVDDIEAAVQNTALEVERRANVVVKDLVFPLTHKSDEEKDSAVPNIVALPSRLLQVFLTVFFGTGISDSQNDSVPFLLPNVFRQELFLMVALVSLPILCEVCPPESLLMIGKESTILDITSLVFRFASLRLGSSTLTGSAVPVGQGDDDVPRVNSQFANGGAVLVEILGGEGLREDPAGEADNNATDDDMLISICSVLMSLLIGSLELGAEERSSADESTLRSFQPTLGSLAAISPDSDDEGALSAARAELSDMASHTMALIAARGAPRDEPGERKRNQEKSELEILTAKLCQVERDLKSPEPPMRARGVVSLRHVASALSEPAPHRPKVSLVVEVQDVTAEDLLQRVLRLSLDALGDSESYVYLAAIQTIVTVADVHPAVIVPILGSIVATGRAHLSDASEVTTVPQQCIKLTEALIFVIRRRAAIYEYLPYLINMMVYGPQNGGTKASAAEETTLIQRQTHDYFLNGRDASENDELSAEERREDMELRLGTGGPLFTSEEGDTVRASRITVVAELVLVAHPSVSARHCSVLVRSSIDALRLDASRPVRRAGAFLAKALYEALIQEQNEMLDASPEHLRKVSLPMAVAMVSAQEEVLFAALDRCVTGKDLDDLKGEGRLRDPATVVRCEEAMARRDEAERGGILAAGQLASESQRLNESNPIVRLLREPQEERSDRVIGFMETLSLEGEQDCASIDP